MNIFINNKAVQTNHTILDQVLCENGVSSQQGIAIAVNDFVIPKVEWQTTTLLENDNILIITATAGG